MKPFSRPLRPVIVMVCVFAAFAGIVQGQTPEQRAKELVSRMTLDEKIEQLHGFRDEKNFRIVPGIPRLGIPDFTITNGPAGAGPGNVKPQLAATALPSPIALASTWDRELARQYGVVAGSESLALGNSLLEAPTINIARVPQNGRTFEGYGEDPYLAGELSVANIQGIQSAGIIANVKHFAANNQETDRFVVDEIIDERALREIYLPAFENSILRGHSASVMCAYPKVNGTFCCENKLLMNDILKGEWKFSGFITSDFGAVHSTVESALAGLDLEMPTGKYWGDELKAAVEAGKVPVSVLDEKLVRRYRTMIEFGLLDHAPAVKALPREQNGAVALHIAEQGIVLLKNEKEILPLQASRLKTVALIGPMTQKASAGGGGSSHVVPLYTVDPADGLRKRLGGGVNLQMISGDDVAAAAEQARSADVAIVMVGNVDREGRDQSLTLPGNQDSLVDAVATANPHTIVVLKSGSAILMPWVAKPAAILEAWYPGEEDGNAVAAVLFGEVNPSGRLPITFPKRIEDVAASTPEQYPGIDKVARYSEGVFVGYRHYDAHKITPLFPFGYGLSYTKFAYSGLTTPVNSLIVARLQNVPVRVAFELANGGKVAGDEIAQLYVGMPSSEVVPQPPMQLKGFAKISLKPGEKKRTEFALDARAFSYWDTASHAWKIAPGRYTIAIGSSSRDLPLKVEIEIK